MKLEELLEGERAMIKNCANSRLLEYGFTPGTQIQIYRKVKGITAIYLRNTVIACRDNDIKKVYVSKD